jgi:plasmid stabilization system protein ParE
VSASDSSPLYVLRFTEGFFADLRDGWEHFRETASESIADEWEESLLSALNKVRDNPYSCPIVTEYDRFGQSVRRLLHQRVPSAPAYRVLYFVAIWKEKQKWRSFLLSSSPRSMPPRSHCPFARRVN